MDKKPFFQEEQTKPDKLFGDLPATTKPPYEEKIPFGFDPIGDIQLRGKAFRGLAGGQIPWWILIAGRVIFGGFALLLAITNLTSRDLAVLPAALIPMIFLVILWRGTNKKLFTQKHRRKRR